MALGTTDFGPFVVRDPIVGLPNVDMYHAFFSHVEVLLDMAHPHSLAVEWKTLGWTASMGES